jgi:SAM-dependent methyltransferase
MRKKATCPERLYFVAMSDAVNWYDDRAGELAQRYEAVPAEKIHAWVVPSLPTSPALILDVGADSGRDAAWLISRGFEVVAVEPSAGMLVRGTAPSSIAIDTLALGQSAQTARPLRSPGRPYCFSHMPPPLHVPTGPR